MVSFFFIFFIDKVTAVYGEFLKDYFGHERLRVYLFCGFVVFLRWFSYNFYDIIIT
ncbi:MAG: hypothetical protein H6P94_395 [Thermoplasmatales archaeon]|nr:hypothetical protein [Thermoplasmatales archaeon]